MNNNRDSNTVSVLNWVITLILFSIPVVNIIVLIVWALGGTSLPSKRTFAVAALILWIVVPLLIVIIVALLTMLGVHVDNLPINLNRSGS